MKAKSLHSQNHILLLDNIRSAHNVGSLFRIADTLGISEIILAGITPSPIDRFGRINTQISKTALGAEKTINWRKVPSTLLAVETYKKEGMQIVAIEQSGHSIDYKKIIISKPTVFIVGSEVEGIDQEVITISDIIAEIPLLGKKESLNVAVAAAVALFRMLDCAK